MTERRDIAEQLAAGVDRSGGTGYCWLWTKAVNENGYGVLSNGGRTLRAHRVAYELHHGHIDGTLAVCHSCDNPPCCNPDHLWQGTRRENNADRDAKGRGHYPGTPRERNGRTKLTRDQVASLVAEYESDKAGTSSRVATYPAIAAKYGVSRSLAQKLVLAHRREEAP